jgi:signal transduction histidine kinase
LKTYEWEALFKSFLIFFILLEVLLGLNFWYEFHEKKTEIGNKIRMEMKLCAYKIECNGMLTDFVERSKETEVNILYAKKDTFYSYFKVPTVEKYVMKIVYPPRRYALYMAQLKADIVRKILFYSLFSILVSLLFAFYALTPLRKALHLNEEFVKDILHDLNTPISSLKINLKLFRKEIGESVKIERMESNIETILSLQENLQVFLRGIPTQAETFELHSVIAERIEYFQVMFPDIQYSMEDLSVLLHTNKEAFVRIVDNLVSNASKYNVKDGKVRIYRKGEVLYIEDTGKGIKEPSRIFERYYKEQERGIGIGLHVVKKLCDELGIGIDVKSSGGKGTSIELDIHTLEKPTEAEKSPKEKGL